MKETSKIHMLSTCSFI